MDDLAKKWEQLCDGTQHIPICQYMSLFALKAVLLALFGNFMKDDKEVLEFERHYMQVSVLTCLFNMTVKLLLSLMDRLLSFKAFSYFIIHVFPTFMPPTLKKLVGYIAFGLSVIPFVKLFFAACNSAY